MPDRSEDNMIVCRDLVFEYRSDQNVIRALDGVSFTVKKGEFVAVVGKNGSGKTTLAKCLNALYLPASGTVTVNGWDTTDEDHLWDIRQSCGMVFQNPDNQLVSSIVEDDVAFGPENMGVRSREIWERVVQSLKSVDMYEYRKKSPQRLSGGQKQRVAIAGVLAMKPECIVLDEPTAMLDPQGRREIMSAVTELNRKEGITVILITHYMEEVLNANKVFVMDKGRIAMQGTPRQIFKHADELKEIGLTVPVAALFAGELRKRGVDIPDDILTTEELVKEICRSLRII